MIKAIQTHYRGCHFRSRLEARWAVFFDVLNIPWSYELEGFDVNGKWYLPDFYLPTFSMFLEVKPPVLVNINEVMDTYSKLSEGLSKTIFAAVIGDVWPLMYVVDVLWEGQHYVPEIGAGAHHVFGSADCNVDKVGLWCVSISRNQYWPAYTIGNFLFEEDEAFYSPSVYGLKDDSIFGNPAVNVDPVLQAFKIARSYRFKRNDPGCDINLSNRRRGIV